MHGIDELKQAAQAGQGSAVIADIISGIDVIVTALFGNESAKGTI